LKITKVFLPYVYLNALLRVILSEISSGCFVKVEQVATVMVVAARIVAEFNHIHQERQYVPWSSYTVSWTRVSLTPKRHLDHFSHFAGFTVATNTETDRQRYTCICSNCMYLCTEWLRCGL